MCAISIETLFFLMLCERIMMKWINRDKFFKNDSFVYFRKGLFYQVAVLGLFVDFWLKDWDMSDY